MEPTGSNQDGVVNMTRTMEALSPWLHNPRRTIIKVEGLVVAAALLLLLQLIFGCCKRRWHNSVAKYGLQLLTKVMNPLIIYTLGIMQSSPIKNSSYPVWAAFLIMASAGTSAFRQHDFYDSFSNKYMQILVQYLQDAFYAFMFFLLLDPIPFTWKAALDLKQHQKHTRASARASSSCVTALVFLVLFTKFIESFFLVVVGYKVKDGLFFIAQKKSRRTQIAERRTEESANDRACDLDPRSMKGYKYTVCWRLCQLITIDQIWDSCGNSADANALKDLCLSHALCRRLLMQRYLVIAISRLNDHHFVFKKLLPSEGDFKRAFRIIEVELGFCYDFFFTKYFYTFAWTKSPLLCFIPSLILLKVILILAVGVFAIRKSLVLETPTPIIEVHLSEADYIITLLVLGVALVVELVQAAVYLASNWAQVSLACMYVKKYWFQPNALIVGKFIGFLRRVMVSGQLRNKINQHSVIFRWKQPDSVDVSDAVKRAVAGSLISAYGNNQTTNGETSLWQKQMFNDYSWALKDLSQVEVMFIWHMATEYCDISGPTPSNRTTRCRCNKHLGFADNLSRYCAPLFGYVLELLLPDHIRNLIAVLLAIHCAPLFGYVLEQRPDQRRNIIARDSHRGAAVHLSRYCAYLIGSVPELLPYHETDIAELVRKVMKERTELFGIFYRLSKIYGKMKNLEGTGEEDDPRKIFQKGVKLGKQLERLPDGDRWELLQGFWAETIIHAAAAHYTTNQHMQHLENGGEFLTHIWALLCHAGVLNLNKGQATDQEGEGPSAV